MKLSFVNFIRKLFGKSYFMVSKPEHIDKIEIRKDIEVIPSKEPQGYFKFIQTGGIKKIGEGCYQLAEYDIIRVNPGDKDYVEY